MKLMAKSQEISNLLNEISYTQDMIHYNDILFYMENSNFYNNFAIKLNNRNFKEEYLKLVKNLDDESIDLVNEIISRAQKYANGKRAYSVSNEVKEKIINTKLFWANMVKLDKELWVYKKYFLPTDVIPCSSLYYEHFIPFLKHKDKLKNKSMIDAGAYIGDSALVLSKYTNETVYSFEPLNNLAVMFTKTMELNNIKNVKLIEEALGNKIGEGIMIEDGLYSIVDDKCNTAKKKDVIKINTIDNFVLTNNLSIGLIKTDVEGLEKELLEGAINTIKTQRPTLLISIYHSFEDFFGIKPMIEDLNLGYKFKVRKPFDQSICADTILLAEVDE